MLMSSKAFGNILSEVTRQKRNILESVRPRCIWREITHFQRTTNGERPDFYPIAVLQSKLKRAVHSGILKGRVFRSL